MRETQREKRVGRGTGGRERGGDREGMVVEGQGVRVGGRERERGKERGEKREGRERWRGKRATVGLQR